MPCFEKININLLEDEQQVDRSHQQTVAEARTVAASWVADRSFLLAAFAAVEEENHLGPSAVVVVENRAFHLVVEGNLLAAVDNRSFVVAAFLASELVDSQARLEADKRGNHLVVVEDNHSSVEALPAFANILFRLVEGKAFHLAEDSQDSADLDIGLGFVASIKRF